MFFSPLGLDCLSKALVGKKEIFKEEQPTIDFAYACVVTIQPIAQGDKLTMENIWVKRPGVGEIKAKHFEGILGKCVSKNLENDYLLKWEDIKEN